MGPTDNGHWAHSMSPSQLWDPNLVPHLQNLNPCFILWMLALLPLQVSALQAVLLPRGSSSRPQLPGYQSLPWEVSRFLGKRVEGVLSIARTQNSVSSPALFSLLPVTPKEDCKAMACFSRICFSWTVLQQWDGGCHNLAGFPSPGRKWVSTIGWASTS